MGFFPPSSESVFDSLEDQVPWTEHSFVPPRPFFSPFPSGFFSKEGLFFLSILPLVCPLPWWQTRRTERTLPLRYGCPFLTRGGLTVTFPFTQRPGVGWASALFSRIPPFSLPLGFTYTKGFQFSQSWFWAWGRFSFLSVSLSWTPGSYGRILAQCASHLGRDTL